MLRKICLLSCFVFLGCAGKKTVDPVVPVPAPAPAPVPAVADVVVNFSFNSVALDKVQKEKIKQALVGKPLDTPVNIVGYTDSQGAAKYNLKLSKKRAKKVHDFLKSLKLKGEITYEGKGETKLLNADKTIAEHKANRRVEINFVLTENKK